MPVALGCRNGQNVPIGRSGPARSDIVILRTKECDILGTGSLLFGSGASQVTEGRIGSGTSMPVALWVDAFVGCRCKGVFLCRVALSSRVVVRLQDSWDSSSGRIWPGAKFQAKMPGNFRFPTSQTDSVGKVVQRIPKAGAPPTNSLSDQPTGRVPFRVHPTSTNRPSTL